ncbi:MAG: FAD-binding oxidoreductase [Woeseiaceae bacterium]|nr:FAD-binding oxidoreductase [Woeseiaceae bacterium]
MTDDTAHTGSYYADTRDRLSFPSIDGDTRADVAVVGGGFTGVSAALALAERGVDVVLLEARQIGWGASGRNGGQLIHGFVDADKIERRSGAEAGDIAWRMRFESRDLVIERIERYGIHCDLRFGYIELAMNARDCRTLEAVHETYRRRGEAQRLEFIDADRIAEFVASPRYVGGLYNATDGHLHPLNLCLGEARAAQRLGARIFERSRATRVIHGPSPAVETRTGRVDARHVVIAGNAYLGGTVPALRGLVIPAGSYIVATEALEPARAAALLPRDCACVDLRVGLDYFRLTPERRLLFGGLCNYSGRRPASIARALRPRLTRVFPQLAGVPFDYEWGGDIAISINRIPQLGAIDGSTWFAQGYSGHGLAPAHLAGEVLAEAICGERRRFDVFAALGHWRLPGGRWFANPALALGMMVLRLRDRI